MVHCVTDGEKEKNGSTEEEERKRKKRGDKETEIVSVDNQLFGGILFSSRYNVTHTVTLYMHVANTL